MAYTADQLFIRVSARSPEQAAKSERAALVWDCYAPCVQDAIMETVNACSPNPDLAADCLCTWLCSYLVKAIQRAK